jgi:hypothetical protein
VKISYEDNIVLEGMRVPPGLWTTNIPALPQANATFSAPLKATALGHLHTSLFSPATQTWTKAILNNHFATWPAFTMQDVRKYLPKSIATTMGHLDQQRQTFSQPKGNTNPNKQDKEGIDDTNPEKAILTNTGFSNLIKLNDPTQKSYSDLTGSFPSIPARATSKYWSYNSMMLTQSWLSP